MFTSQQLFLFEFLLISGINQRHRDNPVVGLKVEKIYGTPALLSGLASLVLLESELVIQETQKRKSKTLDCFCLLFRWMSTCQSRDPLAVTVSVLYDCLAM